MPSEDRALNTPWVVVYEKELDGTPYVAYINDCNGDHVIQTDAGVYFISPAVAEFLVFAVNERAMQYAV